MFTPFGSASISALVGEGLVQRQDVDWSLLAGLDSDRDGYTNGEELGDPEGNWKIGDRDPVGVYYDPGDDRSNPGQVCGDGRVTPPERCDGANFDRRTCVTLGLDAGILRCLETCELDTSGCGAPVGEDMDMAEDIGTEDPDVNVPASDDGTTGDAGCSTARLGPSALFFVLALWGFRRRS